MNKGEFIEELKKRLEGLPSEEIENAINYYSEYFEDAGIDDEIDVTISLGTAKQVAEQIILEYSFRNSEELAKVNLSKDNKDEYNTSYFSNEEYDDKKEKKSKLSIILVVILAILASPLLLGLGIGAIGTIFGLVIALFAIVISIISGSGACILGGIIYAIASMFIVAKAGVPTTILCIGLSLIVIGIGIIFLWLSIKGVKLLILVFKKLVAQITKRGEKDE